MKVVYQVIKDGRALTTYEDEFNANVYAKKINGYTKEQEVDDTFEIPEMVEY